MSDDKYLKAAKKSPSSRSEAEQGLVDHAIKHGRVDVKNADHEAKRQESYNW